MSTEMTSISSKRLRDNNGKLAEKSGVQVVSHMSIALAIVLGSFAVSIINKSTLYHAQIASDRTVVEKIASVIGGEDDIFSVFEEMDINEIILQNLEKIANVLFSAGVGALGGSLFQFLASVILACTLHKKSRASSQFWAAITCGVILCLVTSLILLICLDITPYPYYTLEQTFILFTTIDIVFCTYSLWVVVPLI